MRSIFWAILILITSPVWAAEPPFPVLLDGVRPIEMPSVVPLPPTACFGSGCPLPVTDMGPVYLGMLHGDITIGQMDQWAYRYQIPGAVEGIGTLTIETPVGTCESISYIEILGPGRVPITSCITLGFPLGAITMKFDLMPGESSAWVRIWSDCPGGLFPYATSAVTSGGQVLVSQGQMIAPNCEAMP